MYAVDFGVIFSLYLSSLSPVLDCVSYNDHFTDRYMCMFVYTPCTYLQYDYSSWFECSALVPWPKYIYTCMECS